MKKFIGILAMTLMFAGSIETVKSQTLVRVVQAGAGDTLKKSTTYYTSAVNVNFSTAQVVAATVAIDSISGTPAATATLYQSVDGMHWNTTGQSATWKSVGLPTGGWKYNNKNGTAVSDTSFILSLNPILGAYVRIGIVTTSATQKSKYWVTVKSSNMY